MHGRFAQAVARATYTGSGANNPHEQDRRQLADQHHCKEHMANDKTKPIEEDIVPKHAKAPSADTSGTGDGSRKKRPQIMALVALLVILMCAAIAGGAYLVWQNAQIAKSAEEATQPTSQKPRRLAGRYGPTGGKPHRLRVASPEEPRHLRLDLHPRHRCELPGDAAPD